MIYFSMVKSNLRSSSNHLPKILKNIALIIAKILLKTHISIFNNLA